MKKVTWVVEVRGMTGRGWFGFKTFVTRKDADEAHLFLSVTSRIVKVTREVVQPSRKKRSAKK